MAILKVDTISGIGTEGPVFEGDIEFTSQNFLTLPKGDTTQRGRGRGIISGGSPNTKTIQFLTIQSMGNAIDFGDLIFGGSGGFGFASSTRGIHGGGEFPSFTNVMDFVTISTQSNATDFGDITRGATGNSPGGASSQTRGLIFGGYTAPTRQNVIDFVTIATTGNTQDFGFINNPTDGLGACSSPTRALCAGGNITPSGNTNIIDFVTIATTGNASDFGDLTEAKTLGGMASNATRAIYLAGYQGSSRLTTIEFITIASKGDAVDFGVTYLDDIFGNNGGMTNETRLVSAGGFTPSATNLIMFVTINTTGTRNDFGDLFQAVGYQSSFSDSHGGLAE